MNNKEKLEIWKRKLAELEEKVSQLNNHKSILTNVSNELGKNTNIKLSNLLYGINLYDDISHLNDWIGFYSRDIERRKSQLMELERTDIKTADKAIIIQSEVKEQKKPIRERIWLSKKPFLRYAIPFAAVLLLVILSLFLLKPTTTGFAVLDENATANDTTTNITNATTETTATGTANETAAINETNVTTEETKGKPEEKPEKPEPNKPPVWKSDVEEFTLRGKTAIDLSEYFYDANNDSLAYLFTTPEKIEVDADGSVITLTPEGHNFTTAISFTATDGEKATTNEIKLIVPEKTITINLQYNPGTSYDTDDNGVETTTGIIDATVENSTFSWDADETKLCTRWNVHSEDTEESTSVCYGNSKCCNFIGLAPRRDEWNNIFYSAYGQYGASLSNVVSAQVIFVDYSLSADEPFAEIYYSEKKDLSANYYFANIDFENVCVETCTLSGFNLSSYNLIFEIENAILNLDVLTYTIAEEMPKVTVNLAVVDSQGTASGSYALYKDDAPVPLTGQLVEPNYYDIEVIPQLNVIDKLVIENANLTKPVTASIGVDDVSREILIENVDAKKRYAVNLENLEFEKAILTATASANSLFKCRQWDYDSEVCFGTWEKIKDLIIGEQYELTLTANDPGFIEGDSNITIAPINITNITGLDLIKYIPNITIAVNSNASIDLSNYFSNIDENTVFDYFKQDGISIFFENNVATIIPAQNFVGTAFTYITAKKDSDTSISNVFSVNVITSENKAPITDIVAFSDGSKEKTIEAKK